MNDLERIKAEAADLKLSLEAVASVKKAELPPRSIPEMLSDWKSQAPLCGRSLVDALILIEWEAGYDARWFRPKEPNIEALRSLITKLPAKHPVEV